MPGPARRLNWRELTAFHFEPPDRETFPALDLGFEVAARGGTAGAVLNAANEAAVERFLDGRLPFLDIARAAGPSWTRIRLIPVPRSVDCMPPTDGPARRFAVGQV